MPVIAMTAWGNVELVVEAIWRGARDFIQKRWENEHTCCRFCVRIELHRALQQAERLSAENRLLKVQGGPEFAATASSMTPILEALNPHSAF